MALCGGRMIVSSYLLLFIFCTFKSHGIVMCYYFSIIVKIINLLNKIITKSLPTDLSVYTIPRVPGKMQSSTHIAASHVL